MGVCIVGGQQKQRELVNTITRCSPRDAKRSEAMGLSEASNKRELSETHEMGATVTQTMMQVSEAKLLCTPTDSTMIVFIVVVVVRPLSHFHLFHATISKLQEEGCVCDAQPHDDIPAYRHG